MTNDEWNEPIEGKLPAIWKPAKIGDSLVGTVIRVNEGKYGAQAVIKQDDGTEITTPGHAYLKTLITELKPGQRVKITTTGLKKGERGGAGFTYEIRTSKSHQATVQEPTDAAGKLLKILKQAPAGLLDKPFWEAVQQATGGTIYESTELVEKLKIQGLIVKVGDYWKAT